jgi:hypothetical protein
MRLGVAACWGMTLAACVAQAQPSRNEPLLPDGIETPCVAVSFAIDEAIRLAAAWLVSHDNQHVIQNSKRLSYWAGNGVGECMEPRKGGNFAICAGNVLQVLCARGSAISSQGTRVQTDAAAPS